MKVLIFENICLTQYSLKSFATFAFIQNSNRNQRMTSFLQIALKIELEKYSLYNIVIQLQRVQNKQEQYKYSWILY